MFRLLPLLVCLAFSLPAAAEDHAQDIPPEEWRELAQGRTLVYVIGEELFAYERYPISGNRVEIQLADGECMTGTWSHVGDAYCFDWGAAVPSCFRHVRQGEDILIIQQENGQDTLSIQHMIGTTDVPLLCGQNMS